jgi:hypothetical protein
MTLKAVTRAALGAALIVAACDGTVVAPEESVAEAVDGRRIAPPDVAQFNPQPEPPRWMDVLLDGPLDELRGGYRNGDLAGRLSVRTTSSLRRGDQLLVTQRWTIHSPDWTNLRSASPASTVELTGSIDLATSAVRLTGTTADGAAVTLHGVATMGRGGFSIGGDLMFNPQPDPPKTKIG